MPYVRTVTTKSGATAVQVVYLSRRGSRDIEHLGSVHDEAELEALKAAARQQMMAGQLELGLGMETGGQGGGPLPITSSRMGYLLDALQRAYQVLQTVELVRLPIGYALHLTAPLLLGVAATSFRIANAEVARTGLEHVSECERAKRSVTTCTSSGNHQPITINFTALNQEPRSIHAIINVNDSPLLIQSFTIRPAVASTAPVVHIEHRNSSAGPILDAQSQGTCGRRSWPTVTLDY